MQIDGVTVFTGCAISGIVSLILKLDFRYHKEALLSYGPQQIQIRRVFREKEKVSLNQKMVTQLERKFLSFLTLFPIIDDLHERANK